MRSLPRVHKNKHIRLPACFIAETVEMSVISLVPMVLKSVWRV
jgi:hypothetical protein